MPAYDVSSFWALPGVMYTSGLVRVGMEHRRVWVGVAGIVCTKQESAAGQ